MDIGYLLLGAAILGGVIFALLRPVGKKLLLKFKERAPLVKKYWTFVIPLLILTAVAYVTVAIFFNSEIIFSLVGQISGLLLAVFVGYIAFAEFGESKFDKLKESAMAALSRDELNSAKLLFEEAHAIKPQDANTLGNLLEMYAILGIFDKFDGKIKYYEKIVIEDVDKLAVYYLHALRYLIDQRIGDASNYIASSVAFVNDKPATRQRFTWRNRELLNSDEYDKLQPAVKKIINNHFAFLKNSLSSDDDAKFRTGNYELTK